ncbi:MAG: hypothetical protein JJV97_01635 [SAR324 cluster bacterium]|nr:hypothetical protein [SAR324 cluster bacterium]
MLKTLSVSLLSVFAVMAYYYFGSSIALAMVGLLFVFSIMIYYLKSHIVEIEEHDYTNQKASQRKLAHTKGKSENSSVLTKEEARKNKIIPIDRGVLAAFERTLQTKAAENKHAPIILTQQRDYQPIKQTIKPEPALAKEKEKVKVSISKTAKRKQKNLAHQGAAKKEKLAGNLNNISTANNAYSRKSSEKSAIAQQNKHTLSQTNKPSRANIVGQESVDSIFDELISENNSPLLTEKKSINQIKTSPQEASQDISSPIISSDLNDELSDHALKSEIIPTTDKISTNLVEELTGPGQENITKMKQLIDDENYQDAITTASDFLKDNLIPLKQDERGELNFLCGIAHVKEKNFAEARTKFLDYFSHQISKDDEKFNNHIYQVTELFRNATAHKFAIPFFITALSLKRSNQEFGDMDILYSDIVTAYIEINEPDKLVEAYQNQLAIRRKLKDLEGQLSILDKLGKIYYDNSDSAGSSFCYQQSLEVRKEIMKHPSDLE